MMNVVVFEGGAGLVQTPTQAALILNAFIVETVTISISLCYISYTAVDLD